MKIFAERIKDLREYNNLSIQALSRALKISASTIFRWESGQSDIKGNQLKLLANYFKVSTDYLLGLED